MAPPILRRVRGANTSPADAPKSNMRTFFYLLVIVFICIVAATRAREREERRTKHSHHYNRYSDEQEDDSGAKYSTREDDNNNNDSDDGGVVCKGLYGQRARQCIAQRFRPRKPISYQKARLVLFNDILTQASTSRTSWRCVYGGFLVPIPPGGLRSARDAEPLNIEHTVPQSLFQKKETMRADLHHLFPAHELINRIRGNKRLGSLRAEGGGGGEVPRRVCSEGKCDSIDGWGELENVDANKVSIQGSKGTFQPPLAHRGDAARAVAYFFAVYGSDLTREESELLEMVTGVMTIDDMRRWHDEDKISAEEKKRSKIVDEVQGNENPFIVDATLLHRAFPKGWKNHDGKRKRKNDNNEDNNNGDNDNYKRHERKRKKTDDL